MASFIANWAEPHNTVIKKADKQPLAKFIYKAEWILRPQKTDDECTPQRSISIAQ